MERERVQHHGLLQREEEGRGTEDSGVAEEGGMVVETAVRGMCSLNQASPGAKTERNTSLSRGWGGCWSGQALLFPPAPPVTHWEKASVLPMQSCDGLSSAPDTGGKS